MSFLSGLGTVGGAILGSVIPGVGTGLGATIGGGLGTAAGGLFGGGGSGSSGGGGGGLDMEELQKALAAPQFLSDFTQDLFNFDVDSNFDSGKYLNAMDSGKLDKYQVTNIFNQQGLNPGDKDYFDAITSTIGKRRGEELAGVVAQAMFQGTEPSESSIKDAYQYALLTGNTGTPQDAQQAMASYFAQTNPEFRAPSSQELLAGMKYGPLVGTESGVKLFAGTDRTQAMFDRIDAGRDLRSQKTKEIFNT